MEAADVLHRLCDTRTVRYHVIDHQPFGVFVARARQFERAVGPVAEDDFWFPLLRAVKRYRFNVAAAPLRFDEAVIVPKLSEERARHMAAVADQVSPSIARLVQALVDGLFAVTHSPDAPLLDRLSTVLAETAAPSVVLIHESRLRSAVEAALRSCGHHHTSVVAGNDIRTQSRVPRICVIGPPRWYSSALFSAPRASEIEVIQFRYFGGRWRPRSVFDDPLKTAEASSDQLQYAEDSEMDEPWLEIDWRAVVRQATQSGDAAKANDLVKARPFSLSGGEVVFLEDSETATSLVIDLEESEGRIVRRKLTRRITPGMFVLLRTGGGGDYIEPLADRLLGERASVLREKQRHWKHLLRLQVGKHGSSGVATRLRALGAVHSDELNVEYWVSARCIHPQERTDFEALLELVGLHDRVSSYWSWMHDIFRAHVRAGQVIRRQLLQKVRQADLSTWQEAERVDFALSETEGGHLVALRVEAVAPESVSIPASRVARPFRAEV